MGYPDMMRDIMEQAGREAIARRRRDLGHRPIIDSLTGFYNRDYFYLRLEEEITRSSSYGNELSLILIDTDFHVPDGQENEGLVVEEFKPIIAGIVTDCLRGAADLAFAYGEGGFAVIMLEATMSETSITADAIREKILGQGIQGMIPLVGIARYRNHQSIDELIRAAVGDMRGSPR